MLVYVFVSPKSLAKVINFNDVRVMLANVFELYKGVDFETQNHQANAKPNRTTQRIDTVKPRLRRTAVTISFYFLTNFIPSNTIKIIFVQTKYISSSKLLSFLEVNSLAFCILSISAF